MDLDLEAREEDLDAEVTKPENTRVMYEHLVDDARIAGSDLEDEGVDLTSELGDLSPGFGSMELLGGKPYEVPPGWLV